ncbi:hypothetical protein HDV00_011771 [Rhizophlyctis rosea]|nr:hypothetical protein HDV00_011771 [Rhizophlyctis rosea]
MREKMPEKFMDQIVITSSYPMIHYTETVGFLIQLLREEKTLQERLDVVQGHIMGISKTYDSRDDSSSSVFISNILPNLPWKVLNNQVAMDVLMNTFGVGEDQAITWPEQSDYMET